MADGSIPSNINLLPNELCQHICHIMAFQDLKNLRLVNRRWYENSTRVLRSHNSVRVCVLPDNAGECDSSIENFIRVMSQSRRVPFDRLRIKIAIWNYVEKTLEHFFEIFGDKVCEFKFCCTSTNMPTTMKILRKIKNILLKTINVKKIIMKHFGNLSKNVQLRIELPPTVQTISIILDNYITRRSDHVCLGNETLSALSLMKLNSSPILEVEFNCNNCFAFMLEETAEKGFREILVQKNFFATANDLGDLVKISQFKNPAPKINIFGIHGYTDQATVLFDAMNSILKSSENHLKKLNVGVNSIVPHIFEFPKLAHLENLLLKVGNVTCTLEAEKLKNLSILRLKTRQLSDTCPFTIYGQFSLSVLELDSSLLCFVSSQEWISSFPNVQWLTIMITKAAEKTTVPETFKILKDFSSVQHLKIDLNGLGLGYCDNYFWVIDEALEFKRWTGANLESKMLKRKKAKSLIGLCELKELLTLKIFGLDSRNYGLWIKILVYLTQTTQLHSLTRIVLKPNYCSQRPATQLWTEDQYNFLMSYHRHVDLLDWEEN